MKKVPLASKDDHANGWEVDPDFIIEVQGKTDYLANVTDKQIETVLVALLRMGYLHYSLSDIYPELRSME